MLYKEVIKDFAQRTRRNLEVIEQLEAEGQEVYEVTQLINSTLGLLVFPQQEYVNAIPPIPITEMKRMGWPIPRVTGNYKQVDDLNQLVRYLRNAIAHYNIKFIGDGKNRIQLLQVWNEHHGDKTWEAELSVNDLRKITDRFTAMLLDNR